MSKASNEREMLKILRRLSVRGAELTADGAAYRLPGGVGGRPGAISVGSDLVRMLHSRDLIVETRAGAFALSPTGQAFLRRQLAMADPFAVQHQTRVTASIRDDDQGRRTVEVNLDESPLAGLRARKGRDGRPLIDAAEFAAGERFRADYSRAQIMPRVTANWTASVARGRRDGAAGGMAELTEAVLDARRRVERAIAATGPDFADILVDFCCFLRGIEEIERDRQWPMRSAKLVLRLALRSLARHYGLSAVARGRDGGKLRHWGAEDYRPRID